MCIVAHCQKTRVGQVIDENIVGGTVAKACLQNEADACFSGSSFLQETEHLIRKFLERTAIVSKTAQYMERMLL